MKKFRDFDKSIPIRILLTIILVSLFCFTYFCDLTLLNLFGQHDFYTLMTKDFRICFLNVGQGDCSLIQYKDLTIVIDTGKVDVAKNTSKDLKSFARTIEIDYLILTHADADHVGGTEKIFEDFHVKNFYRPKKLCKEEESLYGNDRGFAVHYTDQYNQAIMASYEEENCKIHYVSSGELISRDSFSLEILYPVSDADLNKDNSNSYSAVIKITYGLVSYLLMADADLQIEEKLIERYGTYLDCDVLKVSHHGSNYATSKEFLQTTKPTYSIISVGQDGIINYGHAGESIKTRLKNAHSIICQTSEKGHIVFCGQYVSSPFTFVNIPQMPIEIISVCIGILILITWGIWLPKTKNEKKKNLIIKK